MEREIRWETEVLVGPGRPCVSSRERGLCLQAVSGVSQGFSGKQGGSSAFQSYGPGGGVVGRLGGGKTEGSEVSATRWGWKTWRGRTFRVPLLTLS